MRRALECIGVLAVVFSFTTCAGPGGLGSSDERQRTLVVSRNPDGSISAVEGAPWWGPPLTNGLGALAGAAGALWLAYKQPPRRPEPA